MKRDYPAADYAFGYRAEPTSGNVLNGLGETARRRARQVFHGSGKRRLEWRQLEAFFALTMPFGIYFREMRNYWLLRRADGKVAKARAAESPAELSRRVRETALRAGAGGVGFCRIDEDMQYEGCDVDYEYAVSIMLPMRAEEMQGIPDERSAREVLDAYYRITRVAVDTAAAIRALGWRARAYGESADLLHLPIAIAAGLGELGKHGSLISREFGPNVRLATVLTDLPLEIDAPVDIGVEDLCAGCRRCTIDCPADAIADTKQLVRGALKWYVDFDRCVPYFTKTIGCGICIEVCPWTRPGRGGATLSQKLLAKRAAKAARNSDA